MVREMEKIRDDVVLGVNGKAMKMVAMLEKHGYMHMTGCTLRGFGCPRRQPLRNDGEPAQCAREGCRGFAGRLGSAFVGFFFFLCIAFAGSAF